MSDIPYPGALPAAPLPSGPRRYPWYHWRRFGLNFLTVALPAMPAMPKMDSSEGSPVNVEAGKTYPIDILIGEWPGGQFRATLQVRKEGADYKQDSHGNPILPLFSTTDVKTQHPRTEAPVFEPDGPIWKAVAAPAGSL